VGFPVFRQRPGYIAAVLLTWVLLAPPMGVGYVPPIDAGAPMARWYLVASFNSAASCVEAREARIATALNSFDRAQKIIRRERRRRLLLWAYMWECQADREVGSAK